MEQNNHEVAFFNERDFAVLSDFANVKREANNSEHIETYEILRETYSKVNYWAHEIKKEYSSFRIKISQKPTNRANNFAEYLWAKIYPDNLLTDELAYTIEINAYGYLVIKIDTINTRDLLPYKLTAYQNYRNSAIDKPIVLRISKDEVLNNDWNYLINKSVAFINDTIIDYRKLVEIFLDSDLLGIQKPIIPIETTKINNENINFWLLIYDNEEFPRDFRYYKSYKFSNKTNTGILKNQENNFLNAKKGDLIFAINNNKDIINNSFFEITKELHPITNTNYEAIEFELIFQSSYSLKIDEILRDVFSLSNEAANSLFKSGLYIFNPDGLEALLDLLSTSIGEIRKGKKGLRILPNFKSDSGFDNIEDKLDFNADIESLAALTAYRKTSTPLAIGLFGNWGKGKSYFMHHLAKRIVEYQTTDIDSFCSRIVNVHFNSWHYSDTNLWASLANNIFATLKNYVNNEGGTAKHEKESEKLFRELNSTKAKIIEKEREKDLIVSAIEKTENRLSEIRKEKQGKIASLKIPIETIIKNVLDNPLIKSKIKEIEDKTVGPHIQNIEVLNQQLNLLQNFTYRSFQAFRNISKYKFRECFFFIFIPFIILISPWILDAIFKDILGSFHLYFTSLTNKLTTLGISILVFLQPINKLLSIHESLHASMLRLKEEELKKKADNELEIEKILEEYKTTEDIVSKQLESLTIHKSKLETEIQDIKSGKKLAEWISERASSDDYKKHLGLISLIREDFERLNDLMDDQKNVSLNFGNTDTLFKIDRIVLFIDDLDRCSQNKVMEVLQAVNMLLSFKLFVVIVGVDPRWLENTIENRYKVEMGAESGSTKTLKAKDYLEKIFQIPFQLKSLSAESSKNLIDYLINSDDDIEDTKSNEDSLADTLQNKETISNSNKANEPTILAGTTKSLNVIIKEMMYNKIQSEELELGDDEKEFMLSLAPLLTNSPRSIKRFVNIYRLIKAHPDYRNTSPKKAENEITLSLLSIEISGLDQNSIWMNALSDQKFQNFNFAAVPNYPLAHVLNCPASIHSAFNSSNIADYKFIIEFVKRFSYQ